MVLSHAWYAIKEMDRLDTPALVVYPTAIKKNIALAVSMAGGAHRLRPHVKTHKSPEVTRLMMEAGIRQFKCATIAEAEMLAMCGADDVLLAYQPIGPKTIRFTELIKRYPATKFSCLIDNPKAAAAMAQVFAAAGLDVPVFMDLDTGMGRTGIVPSEAAVDLYKFAIKTPGITPIALHAYDGHLHDEDLAIRTQKCDAAFLRVSEIQKTIAKISGASGTTPASGTDGAVPAPIIIAGGSPTFPIHCRRPDIQCSPGTFVYWDKGYTDSCKEQPFSPAALVITRVISRHGSRLTLDLGHKSIAAENPLDRRVFFLNVDRPRNNPDIQFISQSEEHLVIDAGPGHGYQIGDVLYGLPFHICPTVAAYERVYTIEDGRITGEWKNTARDRKINI
ncbi:MAG TPA: D-TA family PLP-dependent enzyme [Puia sp.]|jgi:D-serine deaminase-like pyridoxal phosphate-dependent protein